MAVARGSYGVGIAAKLLDFGPVQVVLEGDNAAQGLQVFAEKLDDDREVMRDIAEFMAGAVRQNIVSGDVLPLTPESVARKQRDGHGPKPLIGTGALLAHIEARSRKHYAAARRGKDEWYGFLHEFGVGRLEARPFMGLDDSYLSVVQSKYEGWMDDLLAVE